MGKKRKKYLSLFIFLFIILWLTLFSRNQGTVRIVKGLFWELKMGYWGDIALNILLFIPLGFLIGEKGWKAVLLGFLLSAFIELTQYAFKLGVCEADDVLNNTIGTVVGFGVWKLFSVVRKNRE